MDETIQLDQRPQNIAPRFSFLKKNNNKT